MPVLILAAVVSVADLHAGLPQTATPPSIGPAIAVAVAVLECLAAVAVVDDQTIVVASGQVVGFDVNRLKRVMFKVFIT